MPRPASGYRNSKGEQIPGSTTVIGKFKSSEALLWWASRLALNPLLELRCMVERIVETGQLSPGVIADLKSFLEKPIDAADYRKVRDRAASVGTVCHARADSWIRHKEFDPKPFITPEMPDPIAVSQQGFDAFKKWAQSTRFELISGEVALISEQYQYAGTPDLSTYQGERLVADIKTGSAIYPEQLLPQLGSYRNLIRENGETIGDAAIGININRETGSFTATYFTPEQVDLGWEAFRFMLHLYRLMKQLK